MGRKTRQEKIVADQRRNFFYEAPKISISSTNDSYEPKPQTTVLKSSYLIMDLRKTALVTLAIFAIQFILFFILKNHIVSLPGLMY